MNINASITTQLSSFMGAARGVMPAQGNRPAYSKWIVSHREVRQAGFAIG